MSEDHRLGEGAAFFRWICFTHPGWTHIHGWYCYGCRFSWEGVHGWHR